MDEASHHSYLGDSLIDVKTRSILSDHDIVEDMIIISIPDIVLFPGDTLPLRISNPNYLQKLHQLLFVNSSSNDSSNSIGAGHFGVILNHSSEQGQSKKSCSVGTTFEIRRKAIARGENSSFVNGTLIQEIILTAKGRNRFRILSKRRVDGVVYANVEILPEICQFARPCISSNNQALNHRSDSKILLGDGVKPFPAWVYIFQCPRKLARFVYTALQSTYSLESSKNDSLLAWGPFIDNNDNNINALYNEMTVLRAEIDPVGFAFFAAANLPLSTTIRQSLLEMDRVVDRLRYLLRYLQQTKKRPLCCSQCGLKLALRSRIFTVPGAEGMAGAYVNAHGHVHETITVRDLLPSSHVFLQGNPTAKDSWFPGYAWTIVYCSVCHNHLGWQFTVDHHARNSTSRISSQSSRRHTNETGISSSDNEDLYDNDSDGDDASDEDRMNESDTSDRDDEDNYESSEHELRLYIGGSSSHQSHGQGHGREGEGRSTISGVMNALLSGALHTLQHNSSFNGADDERGSLTSLPSDVDGDDQAADSNNNIETSEETVHLFWGFRRAAIRDQIVMEYDEGTS